MTGKKELYTAFTVGAALLGLAAGSLLSTQLFDFGEPARYVLTSDRRVRPASTGEFGISRRGAAFLAHFRGPIAPPMKEFDLAVKNAMRRTLTAGYRRDGWRLDQWAHFDSDRERFIAYLMLRVNGSLPDYSTRNPPRLPELLTSRVGNCSDQTYRLLMVLDLFSIKGRSIVWDTKAIEGHIFVDAYDPVGNSSYFLDPTNNLMASVPAPAANTGFVDFLTTKPASERLEFLAGNLKQFPLLYDHGVGTGVPFNKWSEDTFVRLRDSTISGFAYELPTMIRTWRAGQRERPTSLCELAAQGKFDLATFQPTNCLSPDSLLNGAIHHTGTALGTQGSKPS